MLKDSFQTACRTHHLAAKTQKSYWHFASNYLLWLKADSVKDLESNPTEHFRSYLSQLANVGISASTQNCAFAAIRFLYEKVANIKLGDLSNIPRAIGQPRIVDVPDDAVAAKLVAKIPGQQGTALRLIYGIGARLNDVLQLRVQDLDFTKKLVLIRQSKGGKSRLSPMPASLIPELQKLCDGVEPDDFLFGSTRDVAKPICDVTLQRAFAESKRRLGISQRYTIHSLRHAAAQFWERHGVERSRIQALLGHSNSSVTDRYLLSGKKSVADVPTPI